MTDAPFVQWERLHPASVAMSTLQSAPRALVGLAGLGIALPAWAPVIALVVAALALGAGFVSWSRFRFAIDGEALRIESGLISLSRRVIPLTRVQDVDIERGPLHRLLGLARVRVETGGSDKDEGTLDGVTVERGERLRELIRGRASGLEAGAADGTGDTTGAPSAQPVYRLTLPRLMLAGLFNFSLVWIAVLGSAAETFGRSLGLSIRNVANWAERQDIEGRARGLTSEGLGAIDAGTVLVVLAAAGAVVLLGIATGLVRTTLADWRFTLDRRGRSLVVRRGLVTVREVAVAVRRIQAARLSAGPIARALGLVRVEVQTLGGAGSEAEARARGGRQTLAPLADAGEVAAVLAHALPVELPEDDVYRRGAARAATLDAVLRVALLALLVAGIMLIAQTVFAIRREPGPNFEPGLLVLAAIGGPFAWARWSAHRWHLAPAHLFVRRGWWRRRTDVLPLGRAQAVLIRQSPIDRIFGLARVAVDSAGARAALALPRVGTGQAQALALEFAALARWRRA